MDQILSIIKEIGVGASAVAAIVWIAVYLVKQFVDCSVSQLSLLVGELKVFMERVRDEHKQSSLEHQALMEQHKEMIQTLGRINGYKHE